MVVPYYFNFETVKGIEHYQKLEAYFWSEAQHIPQIYIFQQDGGPPHSTHALCFILDEKFPIHGLEDMKLRAGEQNDPT